MRQLLSAFCLFMTTPAFAGGIGILATGGAHAERLYFYSNADADGNLYPSIRDYDQYQLMQTIPNVGTGFNLVLGDRDDRIIGDCRFYWIVDSAQKDPSGLSNEVAADNVVAAFRETPRHLGMGLVGLSWGILGDPSGFQFGAVGHVGSAFLTADHTEFLAFDIGPGVTYRAARQVQLFGDVVYQGRYRKGVTHSVNAFVGARYMFD